MQNLKILFKYFYRIKIGFFFFFEITKIKNRSIDL
jgi:hypothetical protein